MFLCLSSELKFEVESKAESEERERVSQRERELHYLSEGAVGFLALCLSIFVICFASEACDVRPFLRRRECTSNVRVETNSKRKHGMGGSRQGRGGYFFLPVSSSAGEALVCLCALAYLCHKFYREGDSLTECMLLSVHSLCALLVQLALPKPESSSVMRDLRTRKCDSQGHFLSSFLLLAFVTTSITRAKHGRGVGDEGGAGDGDLVQHVVHAFVTLTVALSNFKYSQLLKMHSILQVCQTRPTAFSLSLSLSLSLCVCV